MIESSARISPNAIVEEGAVIGANVSIGFYCHIGSQVTIGAGTVIASHVVINGITSIGCDNQIFAYCSIGESNQDMKFAGEATRVEIGQRNIFREHVTVHRGTSQGIATTRIGHDNLFMRGAHVAHDCIIANHCVLADSAGLAGHVEIDDHVTIGSQSAVHQFCIMGIYADIAAGCRIVQDVPPYAVIQAHPAATAQDSAVGERLSQRFDAESQAILTQVYQLIYRSGRSLDSVKLDIARLALLYPLLLPFNDFFRRSTRSIQR